MANRNLISPARRSVDSSTRRGFTIVELLVTIGIIVVLVGLVVPAVMRAMKSGGKVRVAADLQTITVGLSAYKADFKGYPAVRDFGPPAEVPGMTVLTHALVGPGDETITATSPNTFASGVTYKLGEVVQQGSRA